MARKKITYLFDGMLTINGRKIYCKVTGEPGSENDNNPYILVISGGPGFGHELTKPYANNILKVASENKTSAPHFILFDPLGCGKSDKPLNPDGEYTIANFTENDACLVEAVKDKLNIKHMNLYVHGGSFGSMVAMNFPMQRPDWLDANSTIQLKQIISKVGPNGSGGKEYTLDFLAKNYKTHPNYKKIKKAIEKLYAGNIQDQTDYIRNLVLPTAALYSSSNEKMLAALLNFNPKLAVGTLEVLHKMLQALSIDDMALEYNLTLLGHCATDVLNHFFKTDFNGFNLVDVIRNNKTLYQQIPITLISANQDHMVNPETAKAIHGLLPNSSALVIFNNKHLISKGTSKEIGAQLDYEIAVSGNINSANLDNDAVHVYDIPKQYQSALANLHKSISPAPLQTISLNSTTTQAFKRLAVDYPSTEQGLDANNSNTPTTLTNDSDYVENKAEALPEEVIERKASLSL